MKNNERYRRRSKRSRARKRAAFAVLGILIAVLAIAIAFRPHEPQTVLAKTAPASSSSSPSPSPVPARTPGAFVWTQRQRDNVRTALDGALRPALWGADGWSLIVLDRSGSVLYEDRADRSVAPASAEKLIVTDAAFTQLGTQYRYTTLLAASKPPQNGVIDGDLFLDASGDPSLRSSDLEKGAQALAAAGIRQIDGSVVVDPAIFSSREINPLWNADDANEDFMAATSGASIDEDTVEFRITGTQSGEDATVTLVPSDAPVTHEGSVQTGDGDDVTVAAQGQPNTFALSGTIPPGVREKFWVPVHGIPQYAARVLQGLLEKQSIAVNGAQTGTTPIDAQIVWSHKSAPLPVLVKRMLVYSDNHYAEQLLRTLGAAAGEEGDESSGIAEELDVLHTQAISTSGLHLVDGSGLAHANRVTARTLAGILLHFDSQPAGNPILGLLPRGGKDGTLKHYDFDAAAGRVRAKSGHLDGASSLAGYVQTRGHGRLIFAFMINGSPGDPDTAIVRAVDALSEQ